MANLECLPTMWVREIAMWLLVELKGLWWFLIGS